MTEQAEDKEIEEEQKEEEEQEEEEEKEEEELQGAEEAEEAEKEEVAETGELAEREEKGELEVAKEVRRKEGEELGEEVAVLTIPLGSVWKDAAKNRVPKAVRTLKRLAARYLKVKEDENLRLSGELNTILWRRGIGNPPRKVRVRVLKDEEGVYTLHPIGVGVD